MGQRSSEEDRLLVAEELIYPEILSHATT